MSGAPTSFSEVAMVFSIARAFVREAMPLGGAPVRAAVLLWPPRRNPPFLVQYLLPRDAIGFVEVKAAADALAHLRGQFTGDEGAYLVAKNKLVWSEAQIHAC